MRHDVAGLIVVVVIVVAFVYIGAITVLAVVAGL